MCGDWREVITAIISQYQRNLTSAEEPDDETSNRATVSNSRRV
jgi:hypothetical protein